MKFSHKLAIVVSLVLLCLSFSGVFAQTSSLTNVSSPTTANLNSVFIVNNITSANTTDLTTLNAWAVGDGGVILRWDGSTWATVSSPTTSNLYSVFFVNTSSGWAVGGNDTNGVILNYNNGNWSVWNKVSDSGANATGNASINATLYSITIDSTGNVGWVVGANGTTYGWNTTLCYYIPTNTTNTLRSVSMIHNSTEAWAVGDKGTILHWDNTTWINMTSPTTANLYTIQMLNATTGWAGGGLPDNGTILTMNGSTWNTWTKINFAGMGAVNTTATDSINATVYSMSFNNATSAWAVGGKGTVLYWTGTEWDGQSNVTSADLKGVSMVHGNFTAFGQAWAVGSGGKIIAWAGSVWIPEVTMLAIPIMLSIGLVIAVFGKAKLFRKLTI